MCLGSNGARTPLLHIERLQLVKGVRVVRVPLSVVEADLPLLVVVHLHDHAGPSQLVVHPQLSRHAARSV